MNRWPAKEIMQERILDTAGRLFYGQGIRAVGVDTIAAEIGISKRTLYNYFPSKDALIVAYLSRHFIQPRTSDRPLLEQILRYFDWLERWFASDTFRGCPFVNAIAELGDATHPGAKMAVAYKEQRRAWLVDALTQMNVADPDGLATQVAILVEGAIIAALVRGDPAMAGAAKAAARVLLTAAGVPDPDAVPQPARRTGRLRSPRNASKRATARKARSRES
jgi:AcrR family transcriptional regulator